MNRPLSCFAVILLGWHPAGAIAVNYFVDAVVGNDAYTGTSVVVQNGGPVGPWRNLTKVSHASLQPGDAVLFRCGQSWRGSLRVVSSTDPARPIKYSRFGSDCTDSNKPTITSAAPLTGWQPFAGNIYVAKTWFRVYQLFADGVALRLAQHPNLEYRAQPSARGMMVVDQSSPAPDYKTLITDNELAAIANQDLIGAGVHIRVNDYTISDGVVSAFDRVNFRIRLSQPADESIKANWGYYLDNKLWMLDEPGEFFFDGSNQEQMKAYVWMPDGAAPGSRVVGSTNAYGIDATGASNVIIEAMRADKTGVGVALGNTTNVVVRNVDVADSYYSGITAHNARDGGIEGCTVRRSVREGIRAAATNFRILHNRVIDSGVIGSPVQSRGAISSYGSGVAIKNNYVLNSGYHGIAFGRTSEVVSNGVENVCLVLNDCAGLYTGNASGSPLPNNSKVTTNIISGVYGNRNGRDPKPVHDITPGIYLDYKTKGVYTAGNTVSKAEWGIYLHAASGNSIVDNTFYDYKTYAIQIKEYSSARITSPNVIRGNRIFALGNGIPISLVPAVDDITGLATWNSNRYSALYADNPAAYFIAKRSLYLNGRWSDRFFTLQEWQQAKHDTSGTIFDDFSIALDNVRLKEVTPAANKPEDDSILLVNSADYDATITCPDKTSAPAKCTEYVYFDDGSRVTWPVTLAPRRSSIIVWTGNPLRRP